VSNDLKVTAAETRTGLDLLTSVTWYDICAENWLRCKERGQNRSKSYRDIFEELKDASNPTLDSNRPLLSMKKFLGNCGAKLNTTPNMI
jgi:hypothetical protein